ncbi:MAG: SpoIID/LytB domain-containing protein [Candidatus Eiseniibacteriota bacterium]
MSRLRPRWPARPLGIAVWLGAPGDTVHVAAGPGAAPTDANGEAYRTSRLLDLRDARGELIGRFARVAITAARSGICVAPLGAGAPGARVIADTLRIEPAAGSAVQVGETRYRGALAIHRQPDGTLTVSNRVLLEEYLRGVVPLEIGDPGPDAQAAVAAQAVAARTYALSHLARWAELGFDLYGDVRDQVYGGLDAERPRASAAVEATAGVVATYDGLLIAAYYSACCGGRLAAAHETWSFPPAPYLMGHDDRLGGADLCASHPHYRWQERWSAATLVALMRAHYVEEFGGRSVPRGPLESISIDSRFDSGRVRQMTVVIGGQRYRMGGDRVRWVLRRGGVGGPILRSSSFELEVERRDGRPVAVVARGRGNGHGAGMCQAGALAMARQGHDVQAILAHYYPGMRLMQLMAP